MSGLKGTAVVTGATGGVGALSAQIGGARVPAMDTPNGQATFPAKENLDEQSG